MRRFGFYGVFKLILIAGKAGCFLIPIDVNKLVIHFD